MNLFELAAVVTMDSSEFDRGLEAVQGKTQGLGGALKSGLGAVGGAVVGAISTAASAAVDFAQDSVATGMTFDTAMSQVASTLGFTVAEVNSSGTETARTYEKLRKAAIKYGSETQFSATEAAEALNYLAMAGYGADESIEMLPTVLNLAAAGNLDLAYASDMVTDAQSALGLTTEETIDLVDKMAVTSTKTNTSVGGLGEAILTVGGTAKILAGGTTELNTVLGILANNGIKNAEGGTILRNVMQSLTAPTDKAAKLMDSLGLSVFDTAGEVRPLNEIFGDLNKILDNMTTEGRQKTLATIFNKYDLAGVNALLAGTVTGVKDVGEALQYSGVEWEKYSDTIDTAGSGIQGLVDDMQFNFERLGGDAEAFHDEMLEYLHLEYDLEYEDAEKAISSFLGTVEGGTTNVNDALKQLGIDWGATVDDLNERNKDLFDPMTVDEYLDSVTDHIRYMHDELGWSAEEIIETLESEYGMAGDVAEQYYDIVMNSNEGVVSTWDSVTESIEEATGAAEQMAKMQMDNLAGDIKAFDSAMESAKLTISDQLKPTLREFTQFGTEAILTLTTAFEEGGLSGAMEALGTILTDGLAMVIEKLPDVVDAGMQLLGALVQGISDNLPLVMTAAGDIIQIIGDGLIEYGPTLLENAVGIMTTILEGITSGFPDLVTKADEIIVSLAHGLSEALPELIPAAVEVIVTIAETLTSPEHLLSCMRVGIEILTSLVEGIMNALPDLIAAVPVIIANLVDTAIIALPEIISLGVQILMALIDGIIGAIPELIAAIPVLMISLVEGIIANLDQIVVAAVEIILALAGGLIGALPQLIMIIPTLLIEIGKAFLDYDWLGIGRDLIDGIKNGVTNAWTSFIAHIKEAFQGLIDLVKGLFGIHSPSTVFAEIGGSLIEGFLNGIQAMWETVTTAVTALIEGLIGLFTGAWTGIETAWSAAGEFFAGVWKDIGDAFTGVVEFFDGLFGDAWQAIQDVWTGVTEFFGGIWTTITEAFGDVAGWFSETFGGAWQAIQDVWTDVTEFFSGVWQDIQAAFDGVAEWFEGIFQDANELIQTAWADVTTFFTGVWTDISGAFEKADEWFETKFKDARDKAAAMWENAQEKFETAYGKIKGVFEKADEWFETKFKDGRDKAVKVWDNVKQKFDTVWTNIKSAFKPSQFTQVGKDLLTGLWNGIKDKVSWLQQQVSGVVDTIKGWFTGKKGFNTHSPSKWAQSVFENVMLGAGLGLADGENGVEKQAGKVISGIKSALTDVDFGDMGLTSALENARSGLDRAFVEETGYVRGGEWSGGGRGYGQQTTYNVTINSPKAMDEKEAARQFRRQSQRLARGMA